MSDKCHIMQCWNIIGEENQKAIKNEFAESFGLSNSYRDYYNDISVDRISNDSLFIEFLEMRLETGIRLIEKQNEYIESGYREIKNLDHEPEDNFKQRLKEIREAQSNAN